MNWHTKVAWREGAETGWESGPENSGLGAVLSSFREVDCAFSGEGPLTSIGYLASTKTQVLVSFRDETERVLHWKMRSRDFGVPV